MKQDFSTYKSIHFKNKLIPFKIKLIFEFIVVDTEVQNLNNFRNSFS